jgi:hypothetical protein
MAHLDWVPSREQDLADLAARWKAALSDPAKQAEYGWAAAECTALTAKIDGFLAARTAYEAADSTSNRIVKDEAKGDMIDAMRDFANASVRFNKRIPEQVKNGLGIRKGDATPTRSEPPSAQPETVVENTVNHYEHKIRALNRGRNDSSKPEGVHGVRYAWQVGGERPAKGEDLPKSKFSQRTFFIVTHTEADKAKTAFYATCYENSRGDEGPWSPVEEAVIG